MKTHRCSPFVSFLSAYLSFWVVLSCIFIAGCDNQSPTISQKTERNTARTLTIGLIPEQDVFTQKKRYAPLLEYLSGKLNIPIESNILPRYGNILDNFNELGLDGAFFGSFTGALAIQKLGVDPLARPQYLGGSSTYYGLVFVRKGSDIRTAEDMYGKNMVFVDKATTAGYLLPLSYFKSIGIADYKSWFKEYYFSGTHEGAINDVLNGHADSGAAKNTVFYRMAKENNKITRDLEILATSPHVPANGLAVRHDLSPELKMKLKQELLSMAEDEQGRAILEAMGVKRFLETTKDQYQPVFDYASSIGLDLSTYDYLNN